ncbi:MAG: metallophosphoesterase family protein [Coriobacteriia bacterium]|nr:metallophosphoesterase family protein [Coriobacteriia bacterium]
MQRKRKTVISALLAIAVGLSMMLGLPASAFAAGQLSTYSVSDFGDTYWYYGRTDPQFFEESLDMSALTGWTEASTMVGYPSGGQSTNRTIASFIDVGSSPSQRGTPLHTWTYFKKTFELPANFSVDDITDVSGIHVIDDALVIIINGVQVYRYNSNTGGQNITMDTPINWGLYNGYNTEDMERAFDINSDYSNREVGPTGQGDSNVVLAAASQTNLKSALKPGTNVLTCVVGQRDSSSSDLFFDFQMSIECDGQTSAPELSVSYLTPAPGSNANELTFSWHTTDRAANPLVRIWENNATTVEVVGESSSSVSPVSNMYYNRATVAGLKSSTAYNYQVGDGNGKWSAVFSTKTANPASFSYIVVGDPQIGSTNTATDTVAWANTLSVIEQNFSDMAFMAGTGDQIDSTNNLAQYDGFFGHPLMTSLPFASCMGNHEGNGAATRTFYNPPNADSVQNYWYRYGDTLFLVWNCTTGNPDGMRSFLAGAIAANPDANWTILNFHFDVYGQGTSHALSDGKSYRDQYAPVIDEFGIDVVFNGHDHSYSRSYPMKYSGSAATSNDLYVQTENFGPNGESIDPTGTVYFSLNSASGSKYYTLEAQQAYTAKMFQADRPQFSVVDMTANSFTCTTYQIETFNTLTVIDTYTIVKTNGSNNELVIGSDKNIVFPSEYFNVAVSFPEEVQSNVIKLDFAFDSDKFEFAAYTPAAGATVLDREFGPGFVSIMLMVSDYEMEGLGVLMLRAASDVTVSSSTISVDATFVERDGNLDKTIQEAHGAYNQKTSNIGSDDYVIDMIMLSNLIDAFGMTDADPEWYYFSFFDFNGNDTIDIYDISTLAKMIK